MSDTRTHDPVNQPSHYEGVGGMTVFDVWDAFGLNENANLANVTKYVLRAGKKGDRIEDLKKARVYLTREIGDRDEADGSPDVARLTAERDELADRLATAVDLRGKLTAALETERVLGRTLRAARDTALAALDAERATTEKLREGLRDHVSAHCVELRKDGYCDRGTGKCHGRLSAAIDAVMIRRGWQAPDATPGRADG